jgi:hypothetical protein
VFQFDVVTVDRKAGAAQLTRRFFNARLRGQDRPPRFGLPVVVDDFDAYALFDPVAGRLIKWLARQVEVTQCRRIVLGEVADILLL